MIKNEISSSYLLKQLERYFKKHKIKEAVMEITDKGIFITWEKHKIKEANLPLNIFEDISESDQKLLQLLKNPPSLGRIKTGLSRSEIWEDVIGKKYESSHRF